jgi:hypothetical protein
MGFDKSIKYNQLISQGDILNKNLIYVLSTFTIAVFCRWKFLHYNWNINGRDKNRVTVR